MGAFWANPLCRNITYGVWCGQVRAQNAIATDIMRQHNIPVVDLYATMEACGTACVACKPHCEPAGYEYLVTNAIAPAVKKLLAGQ
eukprot:m.893475 g.893475  ORF g.893475 m.893475 type:complete len:86 (+) comp23660_c1_seq3:343-600(+)